MPRVISTQQLQQRDRELLDAALELIVQENITSFSMDKLAANVPYSKGTVYNHFSSKEDLLLGLCNRGMEVVAGLFQRAARVEGSGREQVYALAYAYLLYSLLYSEQFFLHVQSKTPLLYEKSSQERIRHNVALEEQLVGHVLQAVEAARAAGELQLPAGWSPLQVAFHLWAAAFGATVLAAVKEQGPGPLQTDRTSGLFHQISLVMDGLGWQPLSTAWDPTRLQQLLQAVFAEELDTPAGMGIQALWPPARGSTGS